MNTELMQRMIAAAHEEASAYPEGLRAFIYQLGTERAFVEAGASTDGYAYNSYHHLVMTLGKARRAPIFCPDELGHMEKQQCFYNSYTTVADCFDRYTYVEGYAMANGPLIAPHAWLEERDGTIVDPTWANLDLPIGFEVSYFGVRFTADFVLRNALATGWCSILDADWRQNHKILKRGLKINADGDAYDINEENQ